MKSMLSDLNFTKLEIEVDTKNPLPMIVDALSEHDRNLRTALVAALAVIEASKSYDDMKLVDATIELEAALEPFKVDGGD